MIGEGFRHAGILPRPLAKYRVIAVKKISNFKKEHVFVVIHVPGRSGLELIEIRLPVRPCDGRDFGGHD
jgi:hypothetical protein